MTKPRSVAKNARFSTTAKAQTEKPPSFPSTLGSPVPTSATKNPAGPPR